MESCGPEPEPAPINHFDTRIQVRSERDPEAYSNTDNANTPECESPILIDLFGDGVRVGGPESAIYWDTYNSGNPSLIQWVEVGTDDGFLALDKNGNGLVDNGSELFGDGTPLISDETDFAINGFVALAEYDLPRFGGNNDGQLSPDDHVWKLLSIWVDDDADGVCNPDEMFPLAKFRFSSIAIIPTEPNSFDAHGNWFRFASSASIWDGETHADHQVIDVFFRRLD